MERCESNPYCPNEAVRFQRMNSCGDEWWSCEEHFQFGEYGNFWDDEQWWEYDRFCCRMEEASRRSGLDFSRELLALT